MNIFKRKTKENVSLKVVAVVTFVIMVTCNALANIIPINGNATGEVSDSYPNLFAPIGFTFAIWGVIYLLLAGFSVYQFKRVRTSSSKLSEATLEKLLPYFIASSVLNSAWIFAWHYRLILLSTILIVGILLCLLKIVQLLAKEKLSGKDYVFGRLPFSIYFSWLSVAVIANITTLLVSVNWNGWGFADSFWTIVVLVVGALIGLTIARRNDDNAYLLVFVWAYFGILAKHLAPSGFDGRYENVITVLVLLIGVFVYAMYQRALVGPKRA